MTVAEAIDVLNTRGEHGNLTGYAAWQTEALDMAVRSLEEWEKVLDELREYGAICVEYTAEDDKVDAVVDSMLKQAKQAVLEIISKHLAGVTECK